MIIASKNTKKSYMNPLFCFFFRRNQRKKEYSHKHLIFNMIKIEGKKKKR